MKRRIFVALLISPSLKKTITAWQKAHANLPVRWIKTENLHVTIIPPWWMDDPKPVLSLLKGLALERPGLLEGLTVTFDRVVFGPDPKKPRLIWAVGETPPTVVELKKGLEKILRQPTEKRPFKPHLTLARFREKDFARFPPQKLNEKIRWQATVKSFALMESHLSPTGAAYKKLALFPKKKSGPVF